MFSRTLLTAALLSACTTTATRSHDAGHEAALGSSAREATADFGDDAGKLVDAAIARADAATVVDAGYEAGRGEPDAGDDAAVDAGQADATIEAGAADAGADATVVARPAQVWGLGGQSNALAMDTDLSPLPPIWPPADTAGRLWRWDGTDLTPLKERVTNRGGTCAVSFADALTRAYDRDIVIVPAPPVPSTTIAQWQPGAGTGYYESMVSRMLGAKALGYELDGLIWYQGESDATDALAPLFSDATLAMFARLRIDLDEPDLKIVVAMLNKTPWYTAGPFPAWGSIRADQAGFVARDPAGQTIAVDHDSALLPDNLHLTAVSQMQLGYAEGTAVVAKWAN